LTKTEEIKNAAKNAAPILEFSGCYSLEPAVRLTHFAGAACEIWLADIVGLTGERKGQVHIFEIEGRTVDQWGDAGDFSTVS